jgi:uncharacterized delta-60 repeat protein
VKGIRLWVFVPLAAVLLIIAGSAAGAGGALDPSFGQGGTVMTFLSTEGSAANGLVVQPDGKLVAVGYYNPPPIPGWYRQIALVRYNTDGSLDPGFGSGGVVETTIPGGYAEANEAVLQPDGKIVVAGDYTLPDDSSQFALARYNSDGSLDASFGSGGIVTTKVEDVTSKAFGVVLQPDGKIVAGGGATSSTGSGSAVVRYLPNGSRDSSFGSDGIVFSTQPGENGFAALALQPDGKILGVGQSTPLTRYKTDGSLDTSFGSGGISSVSAPQAGALALQADGKVVVVGGTSNSFVVVRVNADGTADPSFGSGGIVTTPLGSGSAAASAVAVQPDGKIVAAGTARPHSAALITVARYRQDGSLDLTFGSGGIVTTQPSGTAGAGAAAVALQTDGKIDVAGWAEPNGWVQTEFELARYLVTSTLTVAKNGSGSGSVASNPVGIACGASCAGSFATDSVTLTATPSVGSAFAGWSGACSGTGICTTALNGDKSVTATFDVVMNKLSVAKGGKGHGTITSSPTGIRCGSTCARAYAYGTAVTLVARPAKGSVFKGWSGACSTARKTCGLTMNRARSARALFQPKIACIVPKLRGKSLMTARRRIRLAHCRTGKIGYRYSGVNKGRVISQNPRPRKHLRAGSKVNLVISNGGRR